MTPTARSDPRRGPAPALLGSGLIGVLGGLVGLGGAEFRLPLLIGAFGFPALEAVIVNKATSLVVVAAALPFRAGTVPLGEVVESPAGFGRVARRNSGSRESGRRAGCRESARAA